MNMKQPMSVRDMIVDLLDISPDKIHDHSDFIDDLGGDSLDALELVLFVEEEYDIEIPDAVAEQTRTVGQMEAKLGTWIMTKKLGLCE